MEIKKTKEIKMSNEIVNINNNFPSQMELQSVALIAKTAHTSGLYGGIGGEAKIMMILLTAKELGVGPCQALNGGIWSIQGKVEISARLMNGLIRRAGHSIKAIRSDDECCTLRGTRTDGDSFEVSFTKQDAEKAGLWGSNTWKKYPGDMLYNRCMSRLGRRLFSDVIGQCYIEGEIREAKDLEKLESVEYEEVKHSVPYIKDENMYSSPKIDTKMDHFQPDTNLEEKISKEQLEQMLTLYSATDDQFKENYEKYMKQKWNASEYHDLPQRAYAPTMLAIQRNIELNQQKVV